MRLQNPQNWEENKVSMVNVRKVPDMSCWQNLLSVRKVGEKQIVNETEKKNEETPDFCPPVGTCFACFKFCEFLDSVFCGVLVLYCALGS